MDAKNSGKIGMSQRVEEVALVVAETSTQEIKINSLLTKIISKTKRDSKQTAKFMVLICACSLQSLGFHLILLL